MCFYGIFLRVKPRLCMSIGCCLCVRYAQTCTNRHTYNTATFSLVHSLIPICSSNNVLCAIRSYFFRFFFHFGCFILYNFSLILSGYMIVCLCVCVYKSEHTVHCSCVEWLICCSNKSKYESSILYTITNISECQILFAT